MCGQLVGYYVSNLFSKIVQYTVWEVILAGVLVFGWVASVRVATLAISKDYR